MKAVYLHTAGAIALTFGLGLTLAACVPQAEPPAPTPPPPVIIPTPPPVAPPPPPVVEEPQFDNYLDAPQTEGTWFYEDELSETLAIFGTARNDPELLIRCAGGVVGIARVMSAPAAQQRAMSITTETVTRQLQANPVQRSELVAVNLTPSDPLLDAMAITKGRFAVEVEGERTLYLPAWVEVSRVIEDCR